MDASIVIALIALFAAVASAAITGYSQISAQKREARRQAQETLARYREPLLSAAFDLQSRLYNMLHKKFFELYGAKGAEAERSDLAIESTLYSFAQYFAWVEILRQEIQFLEFESAALTRDVSRTIGAIAKRFADDQPKNDRAFMLWKPEQRAIGDLMIVREREQPTCMGYAQFVEDRHKRLARWLAPLEKDLAEFAKQPRGQRLRDVQHLLVELIRQLDPDRLRYPEKELTPA